MRRLALPMIALLAQTASFPDGAQAYEPSVALQAFCDFDQKCPGASRQGCRPITLQAQLTGWGFPTRLSKDGAVIDHGYETLIDNTSFRDLEEALLEIDGVEVSGVFGVGQSGTVYWNSQITAGEEVGFSGRAANFDYYNLKTGNGEKPARLRFAAWDGSENYTLFGDCSVVASGAE